MTDEDREPHVPRLPARTQRAEVDATTDNPWRSDAPIEALGYVPMRGPAFKLEPFAAPMLRSARLLGGAMVVVRLGLAAGAFAIGAILWTSDPAREATSLNWAIDVFTIIAGAGLMAWLLAAAGWSQRRTENIHRLDGRYPSQFRAIRVWAYPLVWIVLMTATLVQLEPHPDFDVRPMIIVVGFVLSMYVTYRVLQRIFQSLVRVVPLSTIWALWVVDVAAFGLVWWRLATWRRTTPVLDAGQVDLMAGVALASGVALFGSAILVWYLDRLADRAEELRVLTIRTLHDHRLVRRQGLDPSDPATRWAIMIARQAMDDAAAASAAATQAELTRDAPADEILVTASAVAREPSDEFAPDSVDVASEDVEPADVELVDVGSVDVASEDVEPADVELVDVGSEDVELVDVASEDLASEEVASEDVELVDVELVDVGSEEVASEDVASVGAEPDSGDTEIVVAEQPTVQVIRDAVRHRKVRHRKAPSTALVEPAEEPAAEPVGSGSAPEHDEELAGVSAGQVVEPVEPVEPSFGELVGRFGATRLRTSDDTAEVLRARLRTVQLRSAATEGPASVTDQLAARLAVSLEIGGGDDFGAALRSLAERYSPTGSELERGPLDIGGADDGSTAQGAPPPRVLFVEFCKFLAVASWVATTGACAWMFQRAVDLTRPLERGQLAIADVDRIELARRLAWYAWLTAPLLAMVWLLVAAMYARRAGAPSATVRIGIMSIAVGICTAATIASDLRNSEWITTCFALATTAFAFLGLRDLPPMQDHFDNALTSSRGWSVMLLAASALVAASPLRAPIVADVSRADLAFFAAMVAIASAVVAVLGTVAMSELENSLRSSRRLARERHPANRRDDRRRAGPR